jgi:hypothetical protein
MTDQLELNYAPQILFAHTEAARLADFAKDYAAQAVAKAVECGGLLLDQRATVGNATWSEWLSRHLPDVPPETLSRYMRAAKLSMLVAKPIGSDTVPDALPDAQNRQALIALGIIPSPESKRPSLLDPQRGWVRYVRFIDGFRKWFNKRIEDEPIETWDEQPRRLLKNELRWIAELYQRL